MDWTGSRPPPALAGSDEGAVLNDERPGSARAAVVPMRALRPAGAGGWGRGCQGPVVGLGRPGGFETPHAASLYRRWMSPARPWWKCWPEPLNTCSPTQVRAPVSCKGSAPTPQRPCLIQDSPGYQSISGERQGSQN